MLLLVKGGDGNQGLVISVKDAIYDLSFRSWVEVEWGTETNDYRRGYRGAVDVKCATRANGEMCYRNHLPVLGNRKRLSFM